MINGEMFRITGPLSISKNRIVEQVTNRLNTELLLELHTSFPHFSPEQCQQIIRAVKLTKGSVRVLGAGEGYTPKPGDQLKVIEFIIAQRKKAKRRPLTLVNPYNVANPPLTDWEVDFKVEEVTESKSFRPLAKLHRSFQAH